MATITANHVARVLRHCSWLLTELLSGDITTSFHIPITNTSTVNVRSMLSGVITHLISKDKVLSDDEKRTLATSWKARVCSSDPHSNSLYYKSFNEKRILSICYEHGVGLLLDTLQEISSIPTSFTPPPSRVTAQKLDFAELIPYSPEVFLAFCTIKQHNIYGKAIHMSLPKEPLPPHEHFGNVAVVFDEKENQILIL